jgi:hypothetical protein
MTLIITEKKSRNKYAKPFLNQLKAVLLSWVNLLKICMEPDIEFFSSI